MSAGPLVVEAVRGDVVESRHLIDVAVVDDGGTLVSCAGDPETIAYLRSSAKPIQASVCLELGWEPRGTEQLAVACASHNAEPVHLEVVRSILADAGIDEAALRCPAVGPGSVHHNCSGKHAAMLATCAARGWDLATYTEPGARCSAPSGSGSKRSPAGPRAPRAPTDAAFPPSRSR